MELKFEILDYQQQAVNAVVQLFEGQPQSKKWLDSPFELTALQQPQQYNVIANAELALSDEQIAQNMRAVQRQNQQPETDFAQHGLNFSIEMETGTGKTYVYLRTIFELHRQYGWTKFVIVVPSVAIREGVLHSLRSTKAHFDAQFNKPIAQWAEYSRARLNDLKHFASSNHIEILVMNIDAFAKDENVINQMREGNDAPITAIQQTRPIVIIDEPQNMETEKRLNAINALNALFILRYSATHKEARHKLYSLNPVQAYEKKLVKQIEVCSVAMENDNNGAFVELLEVTRATKGRLKAKLNLHFHDQKETKKKAVSVKQGDDLFEKSNQNPAYRQGFIVDGLDFESQQIAFSDGLMMGLAQQNDAHNDDIMKAQIRQTIREHLNKEQRLKPQGIKVLSLFFIDKVDNYRNGGKFYQWFEEIYRELTNESADGVHNGYFSGMKKSNQGIDLSSAKDSSGTTQKDDEAYHLIMKDKETLLSLDNPLRFIFSHSALKEGWDNPNVFQICTLNETQSVLKKRQEIGRGLRLPVNQQGERVRDEQVNILTVIANESYEQFAAKLQQEYQDECGIHFATSNIHNGNTEPATVKYRKGFTLDPEFAAIWQKLQYKTRYRVKLDHQTLLQNAVQAVNAMPAIQKPKIRLQKAQITQSMQGIGVQETASRGYAVQTHWEIPELLGEIQRKTGLTRRTLFEILTQSDRLQSAVDNPQRFIDLVSEAINQALYKLMEAGIVYEQVDDQIYEMSQLKKLEQEGVRFYKNGYTFEINQAKIDRTIYENFIPLDSETENHFAQQCENNEDVVFYFKLPSWFKIPTPIGGYNPDWAVVLKSENDSKERVYFVAETKNTGNGIQDGVDKAKLRETEQMKIRCAEQHFALFKDVHYHTVEKLQELTDCLAP